LGSANTVVAGARAQAGFRGGAHEPSVMLVGAGGSAPKRVAVGHEGRAGRSFAAQEAGGATVA